MRESTVEAYLVKRVTELGGEIRKVSWVGRRGAPDRLVGFKWRDVLPGEPNPVLAELKAPGKKLAPHQKREKKKLEAVGIEVWRLDTKRRIDDFIFQKTGR